ncbi:hypothetical protein ACVWYQ_003376 [Bradyrhizobium sp. USDA 3397]
MRLSAPSPKFPSHPLIQGGLLCRRRQEPRKNWGNLNTLDSLSVTRTNIERTHSPVEEAHGWGMPARQLRRLLERAEGRRHAAESKSRNSTAFAERRASFGPSSRGDGPGLRPCSPQESRPVFAGRCCGACAGAISLHLPLRASAWILIASSIARPGRTATCCSPSKMACGARAWLPSSGKSRVFSLNASRRLQLSAEETGVTALAIRRWRNRPEKSLTSEANASDTRWRVSPCPSPENMEDMGRQHWRIEL